MCSFDYTLVAVPRTDQGSLPARGCDDITAASSRDLTVDAVYRFAPPVDSNTVGGWGRYLGSPAVGVVTYSLQIGGPDADVAGQDVVVVPETGYIQASPLLEYSASFSLIANDAVRSVTLKTWTFTTHYPDTSSAHNGPDGEGCEHGGRQVDTIRYDNLFACDCTGTIYIGERCEALVQLSLGGWEQFAPIGDLIDDFEPIAEAGSLPRRKWAFGETYRIAPINVTGGIFIDGLRNDAVNLTYAVRWENKTSAKGFFMDVVTGELLVQIPNTPGIYRASVVATAESTETLALPYTLYNITMEFQEADTANRNNGPNGRDCAGGSDQRNDTIEFDDHYTCTCPIGTTGANCDILPQLRLHGWEQYTPEGTDPADFIFAANELALGPWALGETYRFAPINVSSGGGFIDGGEDAHYEVTFGLRWLNASSPRGFFIDGVTGEVVATIPSSVGYYVASVEALNPRTQPLTLYSILFEFRPADTTIATNGPNRQDCIGGTRVDRIPFDDQFTCDCTGTTLTGANCGVQPAFSLPDWVHETVSAGAYNQTQWALGETYQIEPIAFAESQNRSVRGLWRRSEDDENNGETDEEVVTPTFALQWKNTSDDTPQGFLIDGSTGFMLVSIPNETGSFEATMVASAPGFSPLPLFNISFDFVPADTSNSSNGPNGRDCALASQRVDSVPFDHEFSCSCESNQGLNCDIVPTRVIGWKEVATAVGAIVGFLLLLLVAAWIQLYRARHRPTDLEALQTEILSNLGFTSSLNIGKDELGIAITFEHVLVKTERLEQRIGSGRSQKEGASHGSLADGECERTKEELLGILRGFRSIPHRLSAMLKAETTTILVTPGETTALLLLKRPLRYSLKPGEEEEFATNLQRKADHNKISCNGVRALEVSVAMPRRVPLEISRGNILRLEVLVGYFALRAVILNENLIWSNCRGRGTSAKSSKQQFEEEQLDRWP